MTVESFYDAHADQLQIKLEGLRIGFQRKIREPTINRPGLALSGSSNIRGEKGASAGFGGKYLPQEFAGALRAKRFRDCAHERFRARSCPAGSVSTPRCSKWPARKKSRCSARR